MMRALDFLVFGVALLLVLLIPVGLVVVLGLACLLTAFLRVTVGGERM